MNAPGFPHALESWFAEAAPVLFLEFDETGTAIRANAFTNALLGREATGLHLRDIVIDFAESLDLVALSRKPQETHRLSISARGSFPCDAQCLCVARGGHVLLFGSLDPQEFIASQQDHLALNQELASLTRELQKKNNALQQSNLFKDQFLGIATHDLRKPLGFVTALVQSVLDESGPALSPTHRDLLERALRAQRQMERMVNELLDGARVASGQLRLRLAPVQLRTAIDTAKALTETLARNRRVHVEIADDASVGLVTIDRERMEQALTNVLSNAVEASPPGARVSVRLTTETPDAIVEVQDAGPGMAEQLVAALHGSDHAVETAAPLGLGLLSTRRVLEAHRGSIQVAATSEKGTRLRLRFPLEAAAGRQYT